MLFYLAVDGLLDGGEHRLPLLIYYLFDYPFVVGEIQHIVGDKLSGCTLFTSFFFHRFFFYFRWCKVTKI